MVYRPMNVSYVWLDRKNAETAMIITGPRILIQEHAESYRVIELGNDTLFGWLLPFDKGDDVCRAG
jgi:hypothetical protein